MIFGSGKIIIIEVIIEVALNDHLIWAWLLKLRHPDAIKHFVFEGIGCCYTEVGIEFKHPLYERYEVLVHVRELLRE